MRTVRVCGGIAESTWPEKNGTADAEKLGGSVEWLPTEGQVSVESSDVSVHKRCTHKYGVPVSLSRIRSEIGFDRIWRQARTIQDIHKQLREAWPQGTS
jgi:hypothetical protein